MKGPDPELSALGVSQAEHARTGWEHQLQKGAPHPQLYITSPLTRSIDTMRITWTGLLPESAVRVLAELDPCLTSHIVSACDGEIQRDDWAPC